MKSQRMHRVDLWPADMSCVQLCLSVWCYTPGFIQPQSLGHFLEFHPNRNSISFFQMGPEHNPPGKSVDGPKFRLHFLTLSVDSACRQEYSLATACAWNVNQPELNPPQTHHVCSGHFSFSELWQTQQTSMTAELGVPAEDTDKLPFLPYPLSVCFSFFFNNWNYGELLINLSAHYNADLGQDEIKGCRQLLHGSRREPGLQPRLCHSTVVETERFPTFKEQKSVSFWDVISKEVWKQE